MGLRRAIVVFSVFCLCMSLAATVLAADIVPKSDYSRNDYKAEWGDAVNGVTYTYTGFEDGTHPQGVWNSPATQGIDGYNYNDPQDYTDPHRQITRDVGGRSLITIEAGPHGGYLTTTHKCRECHAVHRAAGTYKLTRADNRYEACDWCHGLGAGSGFNIHTDNDQEFTTEYDVGHTMGFGIADGKWKAPDDTYPAYTPNYWLGGFSCFDCHSPHANPQRIIGFAGEGTEAYPVFNPGHDDLSTAIEPGRGASYPAGSWLLLKDPDREINPGTGMEISDLDITSAFIITRAEQSYTVPVNKQAIDWERPIGSNLETPTATGDGFHISEFCTDCHDANGGLAEVQVAFFSEERALRGGTDLDAYDIGASHDAHARKYGTQYVFAPEDSVNNGPTCRACHSGSSDCQICHSTRALGTGVTWPREAFTEETETAVSSPPAGWGGPGYKTLLFADDPAYTPSFKHERTVVYPLDWRQSPDIETFELCSNDGFSWPHKTISWKLLKDKLFGVDFDGETLIGPGDTRRLPNGGIPRAGDGNPDYGWTQEYFDHINEAGLLGPAHDLDSVCLDCHNPYIWNPQYETELILKGLP